MRSFLGVVVASLYLATASSRRIHTYLKPSFACADTRCHVFDSEKYCFVICKNQTLEYTNDRNLLFGEPDLNLTIVANDVPLWNLDRIDQRKPQLDKLPYSVPLYSAKTSPWIFLFDTGVEAEHTEFKWPWPRQNRKQKRVRLFDFVSEAKGSDIHGHGTHCAGIIAGQHTGVHPFATIMSMKVVTRDGSANVSVIIEALTVALKMATKPSVFSLSLGGSKSQAIEVLLKEIGMKHIVVVAAGNKNQDACLFSPAGSGGEGRVSGVFTVASLAKNDIFSAFSNHGPCVDILAPGSLVHSAYLNNSYAISSGTSMSAPHVAGVAGLLLQKFNNLTRARESMIDSATNLDIKVPKRTTKRLVKTP